MSEESKTVFMYLLNYLIKGEVAIVHNGQVEPLKKELQATRIAKEPKTN